MDDQASPTPASLLAPIRAMLATGQLTEAAVMLDAAQSRFPNHEAFAVEAARTAQRRGDVAGALRRWQIVRDRFPAAPIGFAGAAIAHRNAGEFDQADALLREAQERFPDAVGLMFDYGWVSQVRRDWPEAVRRWETARARAPENVAGYTAGAVALRELGRLDEAEALLRQAAERFPADPRIAGEQAWLAQARRDWVAAADRWAIVRTRVPEDEAGYTGGARALREQGRGDQADRLLREAIARFPDRRSPLTEHAWLASIRHDWPAAVERWATVRARFPDHAEAYTQGAQALTELHRPTEAHSLLLQAAKRFPIDRGIAEHLHAVRQRLGDDVPAADQSAHTAASVPAPKPDAGAVDWRVRDLVQQFESLGGHGLGCEFGIFQRDCGAEPLGLLRWAEMSFEGIATALESRFAGVGQQENTELFRQQTGDSRNEYAIRDRRGMMFMRTFVYEDEVPFDKMYAASCRRMQFLARKLIEDLEIGTKIFVYRLTDRTLTEAELQRLHAAMRNYGDNTLLYVRLAQDGQPNGTVELAGPGLMVGSIDRFRISPTGEIAATPPNASWLKLCQNAWTLWARLWT